MLIRPIVPEELQRTRDIFDIAFAFERKPRDPNEENDPDAHANIRAAFADDGTMMGMFHIVPYTVRYDGHEVDMGGIGGVATLPEYRRHGCIRAIFDHSLLEMYERGMVHSALYPFSYTYYRKFGYESAFLRRRLKIEMRHFAKFKSGESVAQWFPGQDDAPLRAVYRRFAHDVNMAVCRGDDQWEDFLKADPFAKRRYTYLWRDANGEPTAYAMLRAENVEDERHLHVADFACTHPGGTRGLFALLNNMSAGFEYLVWEMPPWIDPNTLFPEPYDAEQKIEPRGMARVVNVGEALRLLRHPEQEGSYALSVRDAQLPQNDGVWRVEFGGGEARAKKVQSTEADWTLDIRAFTQLALGHHDVNTLMWAWPDAGEPGNGDTLRRVFKRRKVYLADYF